MRADPELAITPTIGEPKSRERRPDQFVFSPVLAVALVYVVIFFLASYADKIGGDRVFWFQLVLGCGLALLLTAFVVLAVIALLRRQPRGAASLLLPLLLVTIMHYGAGDHWMALAAGRNRLEMSRQGLEAKLTQADPAGNPRLQRFSWLDGGWDAPIELVFDETDEIALPQGEQSEAWRARAANDSIYACRFSAYRLKGHFYQVYFAC